MNNCYLRDMTRTGGIHLGDLRKTAPEKLKTIIRYPITLSKRRADK
jgi:hypothetical protein